MNVGQWVRTRPDREGFTLVELLVVLAVIVMLGSITLPAVMGTRSHSYRVSCKNNLSQIGKGIFMYCTDWSRFFPANRPRPKPALGEPTTLLRGYDDLSTLFGIPLERAETDDSGKIVGEKVVSPPYVQNLKAFFCPAVSTFRDESALKALGGDLYKVLLYKRTGKAERWEKKGGGFFGGASWTWYADVAPDPTPLLCYEYCGEFSPALHDTRLDTKAAWLAHDEDARNENSKEVLVNKELKRLIPKGASNHHGSGGNMLFVDARVDWISAMDWPARVMAGITEWQRISGYKLPQERYEAPDPN